VGEKKSASELGGRPASAHQQESGQPPTIQPAAARITRRSVLLLAALATATVGVPTSAGAFLLYELSSGGQLTLRRHRDLGGIGFTSDAVFSRDAARLATTFDDKMVRLWEVLTGRNTITIPLATNGARPLAFSPDGKTLAIGDSQVRLFHVATGSHIATLSGLTSDIVYSAPFSPDGNSLAASDGDKTLFWDVRTRKQISQPLPGTALSLAYSPDGKTFATGGGSHDPTVRLRDAATHQQIGQPLNCRTGEVNVIAFSPDGKTLATGNTTINTSKAEKGTTVRLWNVATSRLIAALDDQRIDSIAFSPDSKTLATSHAKDEDSSIQLWETATGHLAAKASTSRIGPVLSAVFGLDGKTLTTLSQSDSQRSVIGEWAIG
jgi:WD40 repeat protein